MKHDDDQLRNNGFPERCKSIRVENDLSQKQFSEDLKISVPTVCRLEQGQTTPDANLIMRIVDLYKCDLVWLITGKGNAVGDIGELGKRQLLSQLKKDPKFRAEVLNELGLRSPAVVIRNPRIYNMLKAQRADWQEIIDLTKQSVAGTSDVKKTAAIEGVSEYLTGLDYIDVLLEAGRDPD